MISVSDSLQRRVLESYGNTYGKLSGMSAEKCARDVLDEDKVHDQIALFCRTFRLKPSDLQGKRILEVGSGFGIFLAVLRRDYGAESYGIEPACNGFDTSFGIAREILTEYQLDPAIITDAKGEDLPFPNDHFDLIFSSTVLEHTEDPELVLGEAIRVLKPGGRMQFVYPNYGAFFEGHYAILWIPYLNHTFSKLWVRIWRRDPAFLDTLQFTNYHKTKSIVFKHNDVSVITYGEDVFRDRMLHLNFKDWAGLGNIRRWLKLVHRLRLIRPVTWILVRLKSFDPIILSLVKQDFADRLPSPDNREIYEVRWTDWTDMKRYGPTSRWLRALIAEQLRLLPSASRRLRILDLGCGEGTTTDFLAAELIFADVLGVDRSKMGIQCANGRYKKSNLRFSCQEDTSGLESGSFDLVTCFEVLEHVEDWRNMTREMARLSSKYLLVSFPTGRMRPFEFNVGHLRNFRRGQFERFAASIGIEVVNVFYAGFPFYSPLFRELCNVANSGGNSLTVGKYTWWQKRLADVIYFFFKDLSLKSRGDQFCGLFIKRPSNE
jgi:2-polyprenyl-3-methyl-5-hydroxy-6-metoxy-1,4-benzoquinol methylase